MEVSPNYDFPLDISGEEEAGGDKPEQEELWGRMEEQGRAGIFGLSSYLSPNKHLEQGSGRLAVCHFQAELNGRRELARK